MLVCGLVMSMAMSSLLVSAAAPRSAPNHFKTYMGKMAYYLNGIYAGSVEKRY